MYRFVYSLVAFAVLGGVAAAQTPYRAPGGETRWTRLMNLLRSENTSAYSPEDAARDYAREHNPAPIVRGPIHSPYSMIRHDLVKAAPVVSPVKPAPAPAKPAGAIEPRPGFLPPQVPESSSLKVPLIFE